MNYDKHAKHYNILVFFIVLLSVMLMAVSLFIYFYYFFGAHKSSSTPSYNQYKVEFVASKGGYIKGDKTQYIYRGYDTESVTAVPYEGYEFIKWSDGATNPTRAAVYVTNNLSITAVFAKKIYEAFYAAGEHGHIEGEQNQTVVHGENSELVTAVADEGYLFAGWSDGMYRNPREDSAVTDSISAYAIFVPKVQTFNYVYNGAEQNNSAATVTLNYDNIGQASFAVPQKSGYVFDGWYSDPEFKTKVTDGNGRLFLGYGVFFTQSNNLYAKWDSGQSSTIVYPVLMVFVESVKDSFKTANGKVIDVDYKMSLIERKIYEYQTECFSEYINGLFNGRVAVKVDAYYTIEPLGTDNFKVFESGNYISYECYGNRIPELGDLQDSYRSVITTFGLNDYSGELHHSNHYTAKYTSVRLEDLTWLSPTEFYLAYSMGDWYFRKFIYTVIESCQDGGTYIYPFNRVYGKDYSAYLLGELIIDGEKVGIPFSYWESGLPVQLQ